MAKSLSDADFSMESDKSAVLNKALKNLNEDKKIKGVGSMKGKFKRIGSIAVAFAVVSIIGISLASPSFAEDILNKVVNTISLGHITIIQEEPDKSATKIVPQELQGKIFDKDGKAIKVFSKENQGQIYNADGEKIVGFANGKIVTASEMQQSQDGKILTIKDTKELNKYTCFKVLLPSYLPSGYKFDKAVLYKHNDEKISDKYIDLYFTNKETGKQIYMQQRFACEETKYVESSDYPIEKIKINSVDAVLTDNRDINWETKGVMYSICSKGDFGKDELIKVAESIK